MVKPWSAGALAAAAIALGACGAAELPRPSSPMPGPAQVPLMTPPAFPLDFDIELPVGTSTMLLDARTTAPLLAQLAEGVPTVEQGKDTLAVLGPMDVLVDIGKPRRDVVHAFPADSSFFNLRFDRGAWMTMLFDGKPCPSRPTLENTCRLADEFQIVRVALSGARPKLHGRVLGRVDRTPGFPLDLGAAVRDFVAASHAAALSGTLDAKLGATLDAVRAKHPPTPGVGRSHPRITTARVGVWVDAPKREVVLVYYAERSERVERDTEVRNPDPDAGTVGCHAPPGADCAPRAVPLTVRRRVVTVWSAEIAVERRLDLGGVLLSERERTAAAPPVRDVVDRPAVDD